MDQKGNYGAIQAAPATDEAKEMALFLTKEMFAKTSNVIFLRKVLVEIGKNLLSESEKIHREKCIEKEFLIESICELESSMKNLHEMTN